MTKRFLVLALLGVTCVSGQALPSEPRQIIIRNSNDPDNIIVTVNAASCSATHVQSAINTATNGQIVAVPAGSCTWTTPVTIPDTKGITLRGAGIGSTIITDNYSADGVLQISIAGGQFTRVTAFTFDLNGIAKTNGQASITIDTSEDASNAFRIDHMAFVDVRERGISVELSTKDVSGLIDSNTFSCPYDAACQSVRVVGAPNFPNQANQVQMDRAYTPGGSGFIFFETNTLSYAYPNDGGLEGYGGARYVFRFNAVHGHTQGHHGADSGSFRGTQMYEWYHNVLDMTGALGPDPARSFISRSGTGMAFNNTTTYGNFHLQATRTYNSFTTWGMCDGTEAHDGNTPGGEGYACIDQHGWMFGSAMDGVGVKHPVYVWGNTKSGAQHNIIVTIPTGLPQADEDRFALHFQENREFYNENDSFNGTTGVGRGVIASRPATCTTGVAYWATNEGEWNSTNGATADGKLYHCASTNTWAVLYTPYTYPHPLVTP